MLSSILSFFKISLILKIGIVVKLINKLIISFKFDVF